MFFQCRPQKAIAAIAQLHASRLRLEIKFADSLLSDITFRLQFQKRLHERDFPHPHLTQEHVPCNGIRSVSIRPAHALRRMNFQAFAENTVGIRFLVRKRLIKIFHSMRKELLEVDDVRIEGALDVRCNHRCSIHSTEAARTNAAAALDPSRQRVKSQFSNHRGNVNSRARRPRLQFPIDTDPRALPTPPRRPY